MNHLFVSYSRKDEALVSAVVQHLRDEGFEVWQDISGKTSGIPYSTKWFAAIEEALYTSAGAVTFESTAWRESTPCKQESQLIDKLSIPPFSVALDGADAHATSEEIAARIAEWAREHAYGSELNDLRTWLLSSIHACRMQKGRFTGIPRFKKRKDAKAFLKRLESCKSAVSDMGFAEKNPALNADIETFLDKARQITIWDLWKKPLAILVVLAILVAVAVVAESYGQQKRHSDANIAALQTMEAINDSMADDEVEALRLMANDTLDLGEYTPLLFESYADVLSRAYPAEFYPSSSAEAQAIATLPEQDSLEGCAVELSDTLGNVTVTTQPDDEYLLRTQVFHVASAPDAYALTDGYLAVASAQQCYVIDLARGFRPVELRSCYQDIAAVRFDEAGRICAITVTGDVYVWDNPIARVTCPPNSVPENSLLRQESTSANGAFRTRGLNTGKLEVVDTANDCVIWNCSVITEPIEAVCLDEQTWTVYARGQSGTCYAADASSVLANYSATDTALQRTHYQELGDGIIAQLGI